MMKNLGANAFGYGYPVPVLMIATYNEDGSVNVMNLHEAMRTNAGDLALCIGPRSKTHENVEKRRAFTVALVNQELMSEVDYLGSVTGYSAPDKFAKSGLEAVKSQFVDAPIIEGSPVVIECELIEIVNGTNFTTVLAKIKNIAADEAVVNDRGRIDSLKTGMILYDPFGTNYISLGEIVGKPWSEGKKYSR
ncbi:flavin reductase family protein [Acetobacterium carbinolicum]|uniref:flavin reductase family protein n=1 Tax=Acetobacterium carbinolicum TaxID=52690 RepID=UPI003BF51F27